MFAYGPLIAAGPTVRGARDFDIAPTVLSLLGLDVPGHLDGRALSELIMSGHRSEPVQTIGMRAAE